MVFMIGAASWENQQFAYVKTKAQISFAVTAKLISAFVFATRIVQFFFYLNPKFQASSSFLCLYRPVCVGPVRKPHCWFSHEAAHCSLHGFQHIDGIMSVYGNQIMQAVVFILEGDHSPQVKEQVLFR